MAVIERPYPYVLPRPAARREARAQARPARRCAPRSMAWPVLLALSAIIVLSVIVAGHALMTAANFDRVVLRSEQAAVVREIQVLRSRIIALRGSERIGLWARQNQMVPSDTTTMMLVTRSEPGGETAQWPSGSATPNR